MARINVDQINLNRRVMADSALESPYVTVISDEATDYAERLFGPLPANKVGLMPPRINKESE